MIFDTILISSKDRISGDKSNLKVKISSQLDSKEWQLKYAQFVNSFYTFRNEIVNFNNGVSSDVILNGRFTATSLAAFILASLPSGYTSVYNPSTERFTFTNAAPFTITFPDAYTSKAFGFSAGTLVIGPLLSITTTDPPEMNRYKTILVYFNELGSNSTNSSTPGFSYLVPVNKISLDIDANPSSQLIQYHRNRFHQETYSTTNTRQQTFVIEIRGDDGQIIPSTEMNEWALILCTDARFRKSD